MGGDKSRKDIPGRKHSLSKGGVWSENTQVTGVAVTVKVRASRGVKADGADHRERSQRGDGVLLGRQAQGAEAFTK